MRTIVNTNEEYKGIELYFEGMPYGKTRAILKVNGFRWHNTKKCWYAKDTAERRKVAFQVAKREEAHSLTTAEPEKLLPAVYTPAEVVEVAEPVEVIEVEPVEAVEVDPEPKPSSLGVLIEKKPKAAKKSPQEKAFAKLAKSGGSNMSKWNGVYSGVTFGCDGFSLMVTASEVKDAEPIERFDYDRMVNMKKDCFKECDRVYKLDFTAAELKAAISQLKNGKRGAKVAYTFEDNGLTVNAAFLLEAMQATGSNEVKWASIKSPICLASEDTFYMVCPINGKDSAKGLHVIA